MYRGFNLELSGIESEYQTYDFYEECMDIARANYENKKSECAASLKKLILGKDGVIDGSAVKQKCFPADGKYDVFLSHSHKDSEFALFIAGFLKMFLDIDVFIDWALWDYCDNLLELIDNEYCQNKTKSFYLYKSRNISTAHVHLMLNTALMEVMDNCECLFFLNTPESIHLKSDIESQTKSSWIYSEISMSRMIRKIIPKRLSPPELATESVLACFSRMPEISYDVDLSHLQDIDSDDFKKWIDEIPEEFNDAKDCLDVLYKMFPISKQKKYKVIYG